jgi:5-methylcytosine-specific restriction enzyme B
VARKYFDKSPHVAAAVQEWRDRCLIEDGSLLREGELWTAENLDRVRHHIVDEALLDERSFIAKLEQQLGHTRELVELGAEALIVYYLFADRGAVGPATKRHRVNEVLAWADESLDEDSVAWRALGDNGIGHPGQFFLLRPDAQLAFLLGLARRLKDETESERRRILDDPWVLRDFVDAAMDDSAAGMRHIVLHLLHPESFEPIASGEHKRQIVTTYGDLVGDEVEDIDERLLGIRGALRDLLGRGDDDVDFYRPPLWGTWGGSFSAGSDPVDALELKKQLVLFGPPGTSKTYEAKRIASQIVRRHALKAWSPVTYFRGQERVDELIAKHVRRLQLHPAYSYEEFIRGLRLKDGSVSFVDGYLLQLIDEINGEREELPEGEPPLPWVLILDELNRADLSRVFGEAFSVLEDRNSPVELAGNNPGERPRSISLPEQLYVIGTMNLIDQSLEQIDFALRRRFLWRRCGFDASRLQEVLREMWEAETISKKYPWDRVSAEMELLVRRAGQLNEAIAGSTLLGRDYEIGHTYFFDVIGLLAGADYMNRHVRASRFLWTAKGEARPAVAGLWGMSVEPLLDQYLQGIDEESRRMELDRLGRVFLLGSV